MDFYYHSFFGGAPPGGVLWNVFSVLIALFICHPADVCENIIFTQSVLVASFLATMWESLWLLPNHDCSVGNALLLFRCCVQHVSRCAASFVGQHWVRRIFWHYGLTYKWRGLDFFFLSHFFCPWFLSATANTVLFAVGFAQWDSHVSWRRQVFVKTKAHLSEQDPCQCKPRGLIESLRGSGLLSWFPMSS